jgi:four helix bundle protein
MTISESFRKEGEDERAHLLQNARRSAEECRYYLILAKDLGYGDSRDLVPQLEEVCKLLEE